MRRRPHQRSERGVELVEFAIIVPVLALLLFGLIDFGWAFSQDLSVKHAAREGARLASVNAETDTNDLSGNCTALITMIKQRVSTELKSSTPGYTVALSMTSGTGVVGDTGTIAVSFPLSSLSGVTKQFLGGSMTSKVQFRLEQNANALPGGWWNGSTCSG